MQTKYLIVNADDFGQSSGVNRGIIEAHEHGIVTSASLMTRWPSAAEAASYARIHPELSVGLHIDLGEWAYHERNWLPLYRVVSLENVAAVKKEIATQLASFRRLVGRDPTHIDSHQHVHLREPTRSAVLDFAAEVRVPIRHFSSEIRYCGNFYGQTAEGTPLPHFISVEALIKILQGLPPGVTELGCHPAKEADLETMYANERLIELAALCDASLRQFITKTNIQLCSFRELEDFTHERVVDE
jgi:predicted glycoside hydrolase/deacetylase ChbG (UPF0249 family)